MEYNNPFIKVEWEDTPENLTQERIKRVKTYFQNKYNTPYVKVVPKTLTNNSTTTLKSLDASDDILDFQYQKKLVKEFISENNINIKWELINRLDDKVNGEIDKTRQNKVRYNKWYFKKIEFSNFLSFGDDNVIDFTDLDGITVVESNPGNFGGKTTGTVDLFLFLFFNTTTKTKTNAEIFNKFTNVDEVKVKGYVTIDGEDYIISRIISRKRNKSDEYTVKSDLEFYKIQSDGTIVNMVGEQRRQTETFISSAIGSQEDFLSTILTTGSNLEELIESKPTARGQILTKFMGLENLKQKEEICKEMYSEWNKKLISNTFNKVQLEIDNAKYNDEISVSQNEILTLSENLKNFEIKQKDLETQRDALMGRRNNDIDKSLISVNPETLKNDIIRLTSEKVNIQKLIDSIIVKEPSQYYNEDDHDKIKTQINDIVVNNSFNSITIDGHRNSIKQFEEGKFCPTCKRAFDDVDHTDEINLIKEQIQSLEAIILSNNESLLKLRTKESNFVAIKKEYDEYEKNKLVKTKHELELEQKQLIINNTQLKIDQYNSNKLKLEENQKIDSAVVLLRSQIDTVIGDIRMTSSNIDRHKNIINNLTEKINTNLELIRKIISEEEYTQVFTAYLSIYGKNGISKVIMKNMIPLLNQELSRILSNSCYFTLEININEKNELEFLMVDNETRIVKPLSSGSGYERTISSLAIRSVLAKISSLPKPNIIVMDEVFGKIADENIELVGEFFKRIKNYFEHIFVISHNPLIRLWSNNILMIKKEENISSIEYITSKI